MKIKSFLIIMGIVFMLLGTNIVSAGIWDDFLNLFSDEKTIDDLTKDDIFKELVSNSPQKTEAVFSIKNPMNTKQINRKDIKIKFNEVCGKVNSYKLLINSSCDAERIKEEIYDTREVCYTPTINNTNITKGDLDLKPIEKEVCHNESYVKEIIYENYTYPCFKEFEKIGATDLRNIKLDADVSFDTCSDGTFGFQIDWIPEITLNDGISKVVLDKPEWAWWNSTWSYYKEINIDNSAGITSNTSFPLKFVVNSSDIDYSHTNNTGKDIRCIDSEDNEVGIYMYKWNESGNSYFWCNFTIQASANTTGYIYYGNDDVESASDFNATFGNEIVNMYLFYDEHQEDYSASVNDILTPYDDNPPIVKNELDIIERRGGYVSASGGDDYLNFSYLLGRTDYTTKGSEGLCFSHWTKHPTTTTDYGIAGWGERGNVPKDGIFYYLDYRTGYDCDRSQYIYVMDNGAASSCYVNPVRQNGTACDNDADWHHYVACVYDSGSDTNAKYWVDGVLSGDSDCSADIGDWTIETQDDPECVLGTCDNWNGVTPARDPFTGSMTDLRVYKTNPNDLMSNNYAYLLYDQPVYILEKPPIIYYNISGIVKDSDSVIVDNATVIIINQATNTITGTTNSNSTGEWLYQTEDTGTYLVIAYDPNNSTRDGDADPHVVVS